MDLGGTLAMAKGREEKYRLYTCGQDIGGDGVDVVVRFTKMV